MFPMDKTAAANEMELKFWTLIHVCDSNCVSSYCGCYWLRLMSSNILQYVDIITNLSAFIK